MPQINDPNAQEALAVLRTYVEQCGGAAFWAELFKMGSHKLRRGGVQLVAQGWSLVMYTAARECRTQVLVPQGT